MHARMTERALLHGPVVLKCSVVNRSIHNPIAYCLSCHEKIKLSIPQDHDYEQRATTSMKEIQEVDKVTRTDDEVAESLIS